MANLTVSLLDKNVADTKIQRRSHLIPTVALEEDVSLLSPVTSFSFYTKHEARLLSAIKDASRCGRGGDGDHGRLICVGRKHKRLAQRMWVEKNAVHCIGAVVPALDLRFRNLEIKREAATIVTFNAQREWLVGNMVRGRLRQEVVRVEHTITRQHVHATAATLRVLHCTHADYIHDSVTKRTGRVSKCSAFGTVGVQQLLQTFKNAERSGKIRFETIPDPQVVFRVAPTTKSVN